MDSKQFAEYGVKRIIGAAAEVAVSGYAIKALTDVTLTSIKGPRLVDSDGTIGTLANVPLAKGDTLVLGNITHVTVPNAAEILVAKLP